MLRLYLLLGILVVTFTTGVTITHKYYSSQIRKQAEIFKKDQEIKKKKAEDFGDTETRTAEKEDRILETVAKKIEKGVPKNDTSNRIVVPSIWMRELSKLR